MDREKLDGWCERAILVLILAALVFGPVALGGVRAWQFVTLQGLTLAAAVLWMGRLWVSPRPELLWPPVCWAVLAFTAYAGIRYLQADVEYVARQEVIQILVYALLFFIIVNNLHGQGATQAIALTLIVVGMAISGYAIYQFLTKSAKIWGLVSSYRGRAGGTFYYPNNLAAFLEMQIPVALGYVMLGRFTHVTKIVLGYAVVAMIVAVGTTVSRGGAVVLGAELVLLCGLLLLQRGSRMQALVLLAALGIAAYFVAPKLETTRARFADATAPGHFAADSRMSIWRSTCQMWQDHFWLGVGPGQFDSRFPQYRLVEMQRRPNYAHNEYLNTLADYGLVGAALTVLAWLLLFAGVAKVWWHVRGAGSDFERKRSNKLAFLLGASVGLLGLLGHSLVDFHLHIPALAMLAVAWMALLSGQMRFATERYWFSMKAVSKSLATLVLAVTVAGLGCAAWRAGVEDLHLRRAWRQGAYTYEQIEQLKKAAQAEPMNPETTFAIAEAYKTKSGVGGAGYAELGRQATEWYQRTVRLNPHDWYAWVGYGWCLDWIGATEDSQPCFERANEEDPNGSYTTIMTAHHYMDKGDLAAARTWYERALHLEWFINMAPKAYLPIVEQRMLEKAGERGQMTERTIPDLNAPWNVEERSEK